jgi:hypothetical protein
MITAKQARVFFNPSSNYIPVAQWTDNYAWTTGMGLNRESAWHPWFYSLTTEGETTQQVYVLPGGSVRNCLVTPQGAIAGRGIRDSVC